MNRIRRTNKGTYEVLITPHRRFDSGIELILGGWTDTGLRGFTVKEFADLSGAENESNNHSTLDWKYLVSLQKSPFDYLHGELLKSLGKTDILHTVEPKLLTPDEAKNVMFERVKIHGDRFRLCYNFNDLITFKITNPWTENLNNIAEILKLNPNLKLIRQYTNNNVIYLIGQTDNNTTYEILLCPTLIDHWSKWINRNSHLPEEVSSRTFNNTIKQQAYLDSTHILK